MTRKSDKNVRFDLPLRLGAATLGGYALCWSLFVLLCAWLPFSKATVWYFTGQLAPLPLLGVLLWAFAAHGAWRALLWPLALAAGLYLLVLIR
ncbi:hypothetical protein [Propionivibrio sp.]|uniref:hypothetical protein n=1 Tax=Propionivibrio sp. TaxID=2212460 RepID=UPI00272EBECB|nr:hypothetical protein [Propionivibrio sp.]